MISPTNHVMISSRRKDKNKRRSNLLGTSQGQGQRREKELETPRSDQGRRKDREIEESIIQGLIQREGLLINTMNQRKIR